ncbi:hypothetical protein [Gramella sp. KN1008]|uniref:hypothetical protein n=1 Tax=Gramella sp. KN1008 TaxID=2529298 RepID=UPI001038AFAC|nr:hypothetical protein [Gramella sp. KN1008]TBW25635.1 hypothetical protein EZJ28_15660 [Gramella sp. KN1008]
MNLNIPENFLSVKKPDHPFVYNGPDYLISDRENLIAIFIPTKKEQKNANYLHYRLLNSRIAYPAKTLMIILLDGRVNYQEQENFGKQYFNKIIESKDLNRLELLFNEKLEQAYLKAIKKIQREIFDYQAYMQIKNEEYMQTNPFNYQDVDSIKIQLKKEKFYDYFNQKEEISRGPIFEYKDNIIGVKSLKKHYSDLNELKPFYEYSIKSSFQFDDGIPYAQKDFEQPKILNLNKIPYLKSDPLKPIRIASLFGWNLRNVDSIDQIENY